MDTSVLSSTFLLTLLLLVGLVFFIRASVKDRTQVITLTFSQSEESALQQLQQYFAQRAYRIAKVEAEQNQVMLEGLVRPSLFLALFLTVLAAIGSLCLALVLSIVFPQGANGFLGFVLLSPVAGAFYWRSAARPETVVLKAEAIEAESTGVCSAVTVTAHRDELNELKRTFAFQRLG